MERVVKIEPAGATVARPRRVSRRRFTEAETLATGDMQNLASAPASHAPTRASPEQEGAKDGRRIQRRAHDAGKKRKLQTAQ